jgi:RNA polymerase sigma-70 factor (ECF subfamily)
VALIHTQALLRAALRITRDRPAADDLVQEAMLRAWRHFDQFQPGTNCKAWLFRIMLNCWNTRRQQMQTEAAHFLPEEHGELHVTAAIAESRFTAGELRTAIDALNEQYRTVLLLFAVEGFTCKEIAEMLSVPIGTVMSRLARAREAVKSSLAAREARPMKAKAGL